MSGNPLEQIENAVLKRFPKAECVMDPAEGTSSSWFLDVSQGDYSLVVEWHPQRGIGITSNPEMGYGEGPEEVFQDVSEARERVIELLLSKTRTVPPTATLKIGR